MKTKIAIITGVTGAIGKETAVFLANREIKVIGSFHKNRISGRKLEQAGPNIKMLPLNLADGKSINIFVKKAIAYYGRVDFLINNAGIKRDGFLSQLDDEDIKKVIQVDLIGPILLTKKLLPMIRRTKGRIINIGSIAGEMGSGTQTNYSAAKAGLTGFTKALAKEEARYGVIVNAISPGLIDSDMADSIPEQIRNRIIENIPMKRMGSPKAIAELIYFLLTNPGNYITGEIININGGLAI